MKVERSEFPALSAFLRGYLHEDAAVTYGDAAGAARAFFAEITEGERRQVAEELHRLWQATPATLDDANQALARLGSRWQFNNMDELVATFQVLGAPPRLRR